MHNYLAYCSVVFLALLLKRTARIAGLTILRGFFVARFSFRGHPIFGSLQLFSEHIHRRASYCVQRIFESNLPVLCANHSLATLFRYPSIQLCDNRLLDFRAHFARQRHTRRATWRAQVEIPSSRSESSSVVQGQVLRCFTRLTRSTVAARDLQRRLARFKSLRIVRKEPLSTKNEIKNTTVSFSLYITNICVSLGCFTTSRP